MCKYPRYVLTYPLRTYCTTATEPASQPASNGVVEARTEQRPVTASHSGPTVGSEALARCPSTCPWLACFLMCQGAVGRTALCRSGLSALTRMDGEMTGGGVHHRRLVSRPTSQETSASPIVQCFISFSSGPSPPALYGGHKGPCSGTLPPGRRRARLPQQSRPMVALIKRYHGQNEQPSGRDGHRRLCYPLIVDDKHSPGTLAVPSNKGESLVCCMPYIVMI